MANHILAQHAAIAKDAQAVHKAGGPGAAATKPAAAAPAAAAPSKKDIMSAFLGQGKKAMAHHAAVDLCIQEGVPLSFIRSDGFRSYSTILGGPSATTPGQRATNIILSKKADAAKEHLTTLVQNERPSCTSDMWTSAALTPYMGITAHFINKEFKMVGVPLCCTELTGRHTAVAIAEGTEKVLESYGLRENIIALTTDTAANAKASASVLDMPWVPCSAHVLELCVKGWLAVTDVQDVMANNRAVVGYFKRSTIGKEQLEASQLAAKLPATTLKQDVATRWHSQFDMCSSLVQSKLAVNHALGVLNAEKPAKEHLHISDAQWKVRHNLH